MTGRQARKYRRRDQSVKLRKSWSWAHYESETPAARQAQAALEDRKSQLSPEDLAMIEASLSPDDEKDYDDPELDANDEDDPYYELGDTNWLARIPCGASPYEYLGDGYHVITPRLLKYERSIW